MTLHVRNLSTFPLRGARFFWRTAKSLLLKTLLSLPYFHFVRNTVDSQAPCTLNLWFFQKFLGFNRGVYWPVHHTSKVNVYQNIAIGVDSNPGIEPGCYIQGIGQVHIGDYTQVAPNVAIISANHDVYDLRRHEAGMVKIGDYCWIGFGAIILPGVELGDFTTVGAGSVVTKSFEEGFCVITGNPAKAIRHLDPHACRRAINEPEYVGYLPKQTYADFRKRKLWV